MAAPRDAEALLRATLGLQEADLRSSYVAHVVRTVSASHRPAFAEMLDELCRRAESMDDAAREFVLTLSDVASRSDTTEEVQRLREEAAGGALLSLERALRLPPPSPVGRSVPPRTTRPPDYGFGRPVTLGERKSLARRPTREMIERLLNDPHPDVIRRLLGSPRLVEEDVLRLAAKRPGRPDVLAEISRSPKWIHRSRVRMAVLLNPDTPPAVAAALSSVLLRQELTFVVRSPRVPRSIRALCLERLQMRPPMPPPPSKSPIQ